VKIRIYSPLFPFPVTEGSHQVIADQILTLSQMGHQVEVVIIVDSISEILKKIKRWSAPAEALRFNITLMQDLNFKNFPVSQLQKNTSYQPPLLNLNSKSSRVRRALRSFFSPLASPELLFYPPQCDLRKNLEPVDFAIYNYSFAYSWLRKKQDFQEKKKAVFFHNLESDLFLDRVKKAKHFIEKLLHKINVKKLKFHEKKLSYLCDEVWLVSPTDFQSYTQNNKPQMVRLVTPTYSQSLKDFRIKSFFQEKDLYSKNLQLGYIGNLDFGPNFDGAKWILEALAPRLLKNDFSGQILIVGKNPPKELFLLSKPFPFVKILGFVENIESFWNQLSFLLVPHLSGSGVRIKLLESLASRVPVLANGPAIERIHPILQKSPWIIQCRSTDDWIEAILKEKPLETRMTLLQSVGKRADDLSGLDGKEIYKFLDPSPH
jgi:glycosyltransferase involved in cell wall biosynthesis